MAGTTTITALTGAGIIVSITSKGNYRSQQQQNQNYFVFPFHKMDF